MALQLTAPLVAVIDDDFLDLLGDVLGEMGCRVVWGRGWDHAATILRAAVPDAMVLDLAFDGARDAGLVLLRALRADERLALMPVIVSSAATDLLAAHATEFAALGAATLAKPFALSAFESLAAAFIAADATTVRG